MKLNSCNCTLCINDCKCQPYAAFFRVLANRGRLHIINALRIKPRPVLEIADVTGLEQSAVSHNLRLLQKHGFVALERNGKQRIYSIKKSHVDRLMRTIDGYVKGHFKEGTG